MIIVIKKPAQGFNCLEVTGIKIKHFVAIPYAIVSAHWRHLQAGFGLDSLQQLENGTTRSGMASKLKAKGTSEWKEPWEI